MMGRRYLSCHPGTSGGSREYPGPTMSLLCGSRLALRLAGMTMWVKGDIYA